MNATTQNEYVLMMHVCKLDENCLTRCGITGRFEDNIKGLE